MCRTLRQTFLIIACSFMLSSGLRAQISSDLFRAQIPPMLETSSLVGMIVDSIAEKVFEPIPFISSSFIQRLKNSNSLEFIAPGSGELIFKIEHRLFQASGSFDQTIVYTNNKSSFLTETMKVDGGDQLPLMGSQILENSRAISISRDLRLFDWRLFDRNRVELVQLSVAPYAGGNVILLTVKGERVLEIKTSEVPGARFLDIRYYQNLRPVVYWIMRESLDGVMYFDYNANRRMSESEFVGRFSGELVNAYLKESIDQNFEFLNSEYPQSIRTTSANECKNYWDSMKKSLDANDAFGANRNYKKLADAFSRGDCKIE